MVRSVRLFISPRGGFSSRRFSRTAKRSPSAGPTMLLTWWQCNFSPKISLRGVIQSKPSLQPPKPWRTRTCWSQWCINPGNCAMMSSPSGIRPTKSPYLIRKACTSWLPSDLPLPEDSSSVVVEHTSTNRTLRTHHDTYTYIRKMTHAK